MTSSLLVSVEGALARPRARPLDHVPPFGRDWIFRDARGARPDKRWVATLATFCIDVDRPHRACHWQPLPVATSAPAHAGPTVALPAAAGLHAPRIGGGVRDRRARYAICWSIGALGIISWLIAVHESPSGAGPAYASQTAVGVADHATPSSGAMRVATVAPLASTSAPPPRKMAAPVATPAEAPQAARPVTRRPASLRPAATASVPPTAVAASPRSNGKRTAAAPAGTPTVSRLATHHPLSRSGTVDARPRARLVAPPRAAGDTRDDPLTLIATASALRTTPPAGAARAPAPGFDWTAQLSHRRLTDPRNTFPR
ncbi:hypothetical protein [Burkholderia metallica]|uniref:hypothetical protein n=1 Tax=Burkholderia metallica TaxID=488729 RepID=UPI001CF3E2EB|nr:hypothetical protein [Burkholderia metallica]MCA7998301.1 hypothetical protein [Burkholderia metallica]MCA8020550.1 hypothetical protein [Burkholderia metallica]